MLCRVSCATPVMGPLMGCIGVGMASAMSGQASLWVRDQKPAALATASFKRSGKLNVMAQDVAVDAVIGILLFKASARLSPAWRLLLSSGLLW